MTRTEALTLVQTLGSWWAIADDNQVRDPEEAKTVNQALKLLRSNNETSSEE